MGILISNMPYFQSPQLYNDLLVDQVWTHVLDPYIDKIYVVFIQGKFYTMFSFLFGIGFIIFMNRVEQSANKPTLLYSRRLIALLVIGIIHALFIWWGDILVTYAFLGFILLLFNNLKPNLYLTFGIGLVAVFNFLMYWSAMIMGQYGNGKGGSDYSSLEMIEIQNKISTSVLHYGEGTIYEIISQNVYDWFYVAPLGIISSLFLIFPMFLIGAYFGKQNIFTKMSDHVNLFKKIWIWSFIFGSILQIVKLWAYPHINELPFSVYTFWYYLGISVGDPLFSFFYLTSIVLLFQRNFIKNIWIHLSRVGRMALSHYLFQSVICVFIFYNVGLGLYGKIGFALGLLLAIIIYSVQVWLSAVWFKKFRYGPFEWILRMFTYGSKITIRRGK
ncbi:DUF418 domain-containing protein [Chengkuizengella marina]|uniref:DUF418 domain-containing protein n=1 Tax=Chengkuizengella marina TaxID=2507566 RepID=A0A6N9Q6Z3_9BACL|nr:DUF418 domain-containing protein [Chengkuizengella marina]NBI30394.1 DUF418 domain-containing protein [Chengkuizengella marina]